MSQDATESLVTRDSILAGLFGGLLHCVLAVFLWNYWFDSLMEILVVKPFNGLYLVLGMFLLGFVPVVFYVGRKTVSPALVVAVFLLLAGIGSLLSGPVGAPSAVPTPFALYVLSWVGIVALAGLSGRFEYRRKQRAAT